VHAFLQPGFQSARVIIQSLRFGDAAKIEAQGRGGLLDEVCVLVRIQGLLIVASTVCTIISRHLPLHP
jgi:hypothetical protein